MATGTALLISIRPKYATQIFAGTKKVELRRIRPRVRLGDLVIVYESGARKSLIGAFQVAGMKELSPKGIWKTIWE